MTKLEFSKLPLLLTREQFRQVTGLSFSQIDDLRNSGQIKVWRAKPGKYWKNGQWSRCRRRYARYYKTEAARLAGLEV